MKSLVAISPPQKLPSASLSVSLVTYRPDIEQLRHTLVSLDAAISAAVREAALRSVELHLIDNGDGRGIDESLYSVPDPTTTRLITHTGHGNVGYGRGHNIGIRESRSDYHLVLNPDVIMDQRAIVNSLAFLHEHPDVGLVTPAVNDASGEAQYLCRDYPSVFVLALRTACPAVLQRRFRSYMDRYELRDRIGQSVCLDVPLASGCFMFFRRSVLEELSGFSPRYFMYFEDHDLSVRLRRVARIGYVPSVRIVHFGGNASRKGLRHIRMYIRSAATFFRTHGWRIV